MFEYTENPFSQVAHNHLCVHPGGEEWRTLSGESDAKMKTRMRKNKNCLKCKGLRKLGVQKKQNKDFEGIEFTMISFFLPSETYYLRCQRFEQDWGRWFCGVLREEGLGLGNTLEITLLFLIALYLMWLFRWVKLKCLQWFPTQS